MFLLLVDFFPMYSVLVDPSTELSVIDCALCASVHCWAGFLCMDHQRTRPRIIHIATSMDLLIGWLG